MGGLFYLGSILAFLFVTYWYVKNVNSSTPGRIGLLAWKGDSEVKMPKERKRFDPHLDAEFSRESDT